MIISGKELAADIKKEIRADVEKYKGIYGREPHLVVILVGEDPGSVSYVKGKSKSCDEVGFKNTTVRMPADITEEELLAEVERLNNDDSASVAAPYRFRQSYRGAA